MVKRFRDLGLEPIAEHGTAIQTSFHLVQRLKSFCIIGIPFKELPEEALRDFIGGKIHTVQGSEQSQRIQSGDF